MNPEWLSAHLDGELSEVEAAELDEVLARDRDLRDEYDSLARVRATLREAAVVAPAGAVDRIVARVAAAPEDAAVVALAARRRVPSIAAVAAAVVIIASVVGGVGGTTAVPALGELVARHEAAAAESEAFMADAVEMPMDSAATIGPSMPAEFAMQHAFVDGSTVHLVYLSAEAGAVSVFRQTGDTDLGELPDGYISSAGPLPMWSATHRGSHVAVVDGSGFVWTIVAAEPQDTMMVAMMDDLPTRDPSFGERVRDVADVVAAPFRFWD